MVQVVCSKKTVPIRLTDERWDHIVDEHGELVGERDHVLETVQNPQRVFAGQDGELLAVSEVLPGKYLVAVYRELVNDGFIITAFLTRRLRQLERRTQRWP